MLYLGAQQKLYPPALAPRTMSAETICRCAGRRYPYPNLSVCMGGCLQASKGTLLVCWQSKHDNID